MKLIENVLITQPVSYLSALCALHTTFLKNKTDLSTDWKIIPESRKVVQLSA